jgi:hypothetical protein
MVALCSLAASTVKLGLLSCFGGRPASIKTYDPSVGAACITYMCKSPTVQVRFTVRVADCPLWNLNLMSVVGLLGSTAGLPSSVFVLTAISEDYCWGPPPIETPAPEKEVYLGGGGNSKV